MKTKKVIKKFVIVSGALLFVSGLAKFIGAYGNASILQSVDPIFSISFRHLFWMVGSLEMIVAAICIQGNNVEIQAVLLACISTSFMTYRLGLKWVHYHNRYLRHESRPRGIHHTPHRNAPALCGHPNKRPAHCVSWVDFASALALPNNFAFSPPAERRKRP